MLPYDTGINSIDLLNQKCKCVFHDRSKRSECLLIAYHVSRRKSEQILIPPLSPLCHSTILLLAALALGTRCAKTVLLYSGHHYFTYESVKSDQKCIEKWISIIQKFSLLEVIFFLILLCWNHCVVLFKAKRKGKNFGQFFNVCCLQGVSYTTATRHPKTRQHNFLVATTDRSVVKNWC